MSSSIELWNIDTAYILCIREPRVQPACLTVIDMLMETIRYGFIRSASVSKLPLSTAILSQCMRIPRQLRNLFWRNKQTQRPMHVYFWLFIPWQGWMCITATFITFQICCFLSFASIWIQIHCEMSWNMFLIYITYANLLNRSRTIWTHLS